jgi:hypothetical protein
MDTISTSEAISPKPAPSAPAGLPTWRQLSTELFDRDGLDVLFTYARNLLTGTVIVAAGLHAANHKGTIPLPGLFWSLHYAGYAVVLIGVVMLILNLTDGLRRLARREQSLLLRVVAAMAYIAISMRLTQVIVLFRYGL